MSRNYDPALECQTLFCKKRRADDSSYCPVCIHARVQQAWEADQRIRAERAAEEAATQRNQRIEMLQARLHAIEDGVVKDTLNFLLEEARNHEQAT